MLNYEKVNKERVICNDEIYEEVSEEFEIDINLVKEVIEANSKFTRKVIERGAFESVIFPYLGKIKAKLRSVQKATAKIKRP